MLATVPTKKNSFAVTLKPVVRFSVLWFGPVSLSKGSGLVVAQLLGTVTHATP